MLGYNILYVKTTWIAKCMTATKNDQNVVILHGNFLTDGAESTDYFHW